MVGLAALLLVLFVGFSRVFEGGHYLSDVLAGYAVAMTWGSLVYTLLEGLVVRRLAKRARNAQVAISD